jgi:hypothetical protein
LVKKWILDPDNRTDFSVEPSAAVVPADDSNGHYYEINVRPALHVAQD